jgi:hypothetical protein
MNNWNHNEDHKDLDPAGNSLNADERFLEAVRHTLDESCEGLDGYTRSRLTAIRHEALAQQSDHRRWLRWIPAGGLATLCSVIVAFTLTVQPGGTTDVEPVSNDALQDIDLLTAEEGLEFFEEYEFYQWLAENGRSA